MADPQPFEGGGGWAERVGRKNHCRKFGGPSLVISTSIVIILVIAYVFGEYVSAAKV